MDSPEEQERPVAVDKRERKAKQDSALLRFGRDLTELAAKGCLPPLIGRRAEMLKITQILLQSRKNNLILVGEPGVGKTGIVEGFAQLLAEGRLLDALGRPAVIENSLTSLVGRNGPFHGLGFGVSPSRDKCGGQGRKCDFREAVIILTSNLGSGVVKKRRMGFGMEEEEHRQDACAPVEEAMRKHLRPVLVNRLTKIVHFIAPAGQIQFLRVDVC